MAKSDKIRSVLSPVLSRLLAGYIKLVYRTSRKIYEPDDYAGHMHANHPFIGSMWHGQFLLGPRLTPPDLRTSIMVAKHGDGDVLGGTIRHFGLTLIRGGGAGHRKRDRGGMRALRESVRTLQEGTTIGMTADIPPGPARKAGLGIITIARISGRPILPTASATSRFHAFNTWSRMTLNLPFSKLVGDPIHVPNDASPEELERLRQLLEERMNLATERAYELVGRSTEDIRPYTLAPSGSDAAQMRPPVSLPLKVYRLATNALSFAAPMILKKRAGQHKEDPTRRNERLGRPDIPRPDGRLIWFHAASVGETNAILPILPEIEKRRPDIKILLTTGTVTSAKLAQTRLSENALHQYVPLDAQKFVQSFLAHWQPDLAIFVESEIWPNLILETSSLGKPLLLINARMSKKSFRSWKRYGILSRPLFSRLDLVLAQSERIADWYRFLGSPEVRTTGNLKIDAPPPPVDNEKLAQLKEAISQRPVFLAASTHPGEDDLIAAAHKIMARTMPNILTIVVPRHPERGISISEDFRDIGLKTALRSNNELPAPHHDIYIADTIGELGIFYASAPLAFIGGSLIPHGGQNPVEAIKLDTAPLTGPFRQNFSDIYSSLLKAGGAAEVGSAEDIADMAINLLQNPSELSAMRQSAHQGLVELTGALDDTVETILSHLDN